jgi:hypothetical protein
LIVSFLFWALKVNGFNLVFGLMVVVDGFDPLVLGLMVVIDGFCYNLNLEFATKIKAKQKGSELRTSQSKKKGLKHIGGVKRKHS